MSVLDVLQERGFIKQMSHEAEIKELLEKEKITFYIGFDPTADSLHVGHFIALMMMSHMQKAGHRPIVLLGGGTGMVGDPSGKDEMRKMLTPEFIAHNIACFKKQMSRFIDFSEGKAIIANNADWLLNLNYVNLLREVGVHFSVNRMLTAECFKKRWEKGLTFFEFNYMIMQSYDFWKLHQDYEELKRQQEAEEAELAKERRRQEAVLKIKKMFGKNAILKGLNYADGATQRDRNQQIGGHHE